MVYRYEMGLWDIADPPNDTKVFTSKPLCYSTRLKFPCKLLQLFYSSFMLASPVSLCPDSMAPSHHLKSFPEFKALSGARRHNFKTSN